MKHLYLFFAITTLFFQTTIYGDETSASSTDTPSVSIETLATPAATDSPIVSEAANDPAPAVEPSTEETSFVQPTEEISVQAVLEKTEESSITTPSDATSPEVSVDSTNTSAVSEPTDAPSETSSSQQIEASLTAKTETSAEDNSSATNASATEETIEPNSSENLSCIYSYPARIDVKTSWDLFVTGSYLYWQPKEEGLELAESWPTDHNDRVIVYNMDFDYHSGFKVGLGTNFNHDNWVAYLDYTRLHAKNHRSISNPANSSFLNPFWNFGEDSAITASWKLRYDMLDLKFSRPFYEGCKMTASGFLGMKGGWIKQRYQFDELPASGPWYHAVFHSNSWLIGPQAGMNMNYLLGAGFRFFGDADASLLYQHVKTKILVPYVGSSDYFSNAKNYTSQITPNFDVDMGLGWGSYFDHKNWHFDLSAAYEFQYYWDQNFMKNLFAITKNRDLISGQSHQKGKIKDLVLHGLTITARFDF